MNSGDGDCNMQQNDDEEGAAGKGENSGEDG
mgnify:CR=1 FL=1